MSIRLLPKFALIVAIVAFFFFILFMQHNKPGAATILFLCALVWFVLAGVAWYANELQRANNPDQ